VNLGSDHPSIIEAIVKGQNEKKGQFPKIITCPNEVHTRNDECASKILILSDGGSLHGRRLRPIDRQTSMRYRTRRRRNTRPRSCCTQRFMRSRTRLDLRWSISLHNRGRDARKPNGVHSLDTGCAGSEADRRAVLQIHWRDQVWQEREGGL
jgi:hypothetical protein